MQEGPLQLNTHILFIDPPAVYEHDEPTYSHVDFLWAVNAHERIYPRVLQLVNQYTK